MSRRDGAGHGERGDLGPHGNGPADDCTGCFHVKYVGVFYVTGYNHSGNSINGYFGGLTTAASSGFTPKPGPISKNAPVQ